MCRPERIDLDCVRCCRVHTLDADERLMLGLACAAHQPDDLARLWLRRAETATGAPSRNRADAEALLSILK